MALSVPSRGQARAQHRLHAAPGSGHCRCAGVLSEGARLTSGSSSAQGHTRWPCTEPPGVATLATRAPCLAPSQSSAFKVPEQHHLAGPSGDQAAMRFNEGLQVVCQMRQLRLLASNSLIASISINFRSDEAVHVTTDRFGPTGNVPLHENRLAGRKLSVACVAVDAPEPSYVTTRLPRVCKGGIYDIPQAIQKV